MARKSAKRLFWIEEDADASKEFEELLQERFKTEEMHKKVLACQSQAINAKQQGNTELNVFIEQNKTT